MSKLICKIADHFMTVVFLSQRKNVGCMFLYGCECTSIFKLCFSVSQFTIWTIVTLSVNKIAFVVKS